MNINNNKISYKPFGYETAFSVIFTKETPSTLNEVSNFSYKKILVVFDTNVQKNIVSKVVNLFQNSEGKVKLVPFIYGHKSLDKIVFLWKIMVDFVPDLIVGIGGGTTSDLVGFAASTYQRGIPDIIFPTTVLGMIDASLGGKTAIDFHGVKNCIGAIHYPICVINIMETLKTLPRKEFLSGLAESVKAAVLFDANFFLLLENYASKQDFSYDNYQLFKIIKHSAGLKAQNSEASFPHKIKLLYGHAVGHALEILAKGKISHGDGVSIGMTIEGAIACLLGIWNNAEWIKQTNLLRKFHLPTLIPSKYSVSMITEKMKLYKKLITPNAFGLVLPNKIGQVQENNKEYLIFIHKNDIRLLFNKAIKLVNENLH